MGLAVVMDQIRRFSIPAQNRLWPAATGLAGLKRCRFRRPGFKQAKADFGTIRPQSRLPRALDRPEICLLIYVGLSPATRVNSKRAG